MLGVLRDRGGRVLPLEQLYRQMFNPQLYLLAYGRIYANEGAMTPGSAGKPWTGCPRARPLGPRESGMPGRRRTDSRLSVLPSGVREHAQGGPDGCYEHPLPGP